MRSGWWLGLAVGAVAWVALAASYAAEPTASAGRLEFETTIRAEFTGFAPRHVVAIWIETADGRFVRTLKVFGRRRQNWLLAWKKASGGSAPDAVTGATCRDWGAVDATWDGKDERGQVVADGPYVLKVETTWDNCSGPVLKVPFQKGPVSVEATPPASPPYSRTRLSWSPGT